MNDTEYSIKNGRTISEIPNLPGNIAEYFSKNYCTMEMSVCHTDVENGYGTRISKCFKVLRPFEACTRCGYHSLWNPDDRESKCLRHTYKRGWDVVFAYTLDTGETKMSLEDAFNDFLSVQPQSWGEPVKKLLV